MNKTKLPVIVPPLVDAIGTGLAIGTSPDH